MTRLIMVFLILLRAFLLIAPFIVTLIASVIFDEFHYAVSLGVLTWLFTSVLTFEPE